MHPVPSMYVVLRPRRDLDGPFRVLPWFLQLPQYARVEACQYATPGHVNLKKFSAAVTPRTDNVRPHRAPAKWVDGIRAGASVVFEFREAGAFPRGERRCFILCHITPRCAHQRRDSDQLRVILRRSRQHIPCTWGLDPHSATPPRWTWCRG